MKLILAWLGLFLLTFKTLMDNAMTIASIYLLGKWVFYNTPLNGTPFFVFTGSNLLLNKYANPLLIGLRNM